MLRGGTIRTDLILSAEIMVIALKEVIEEGFVQRAIILVVVAFLITAIVHGMVALIVQLDDVGLALVGRESPVSQRIGRMKVLSVPELLGAISVIGTAAMVWVLVNTSISAAIGLLVGVVMVAVVSRVHSRDAAR